MSNKRQTYPLGDTPTSADLPGVPFDKRFVSDFLPNRHYKAVMIGRIRPPKKGEWYLSGAIPAAYRAPNDLTTSYHIMKLVRVETITTVTEKVLPL